MADKESLSHHLECRPDTLLDAVAPFLLTLWRLADPCCCFVYILPGDVTKMQKLYCWETPNTLQAVQDAQLSTSVTSTPHVSNQVKTAKPPLHVPRGLQGSKRHLPLSEIYQPLGLASWGQIFPVLIKQKLPLLCFRESAGQSVP